MTPALRLVAWGAGAGVRRAGAVAADAFRSPAGREAARARRETRDARRLARLLGALKGPYAKLGQFASLRYDVLAPEAREALASLRDRVPPLPFGAVRGVLEEELGAPLERHFAHVEATPLGAASIAQAHAARLPDGTEVVVKVQYPWLRESLPRDLALLRRLLRLLTRAPDAHRLFDEFARGIAEELDFEREARVAAEIARNLEGERGVVVPRVLASHSAGRVLTMERVRAVPIRDAAALERLRVDPAEVVEILVRAYAKQVFVDGLFHADPHPGNLFVLEDAAGGPRVLFVDFGLSRRLDPALRREMQAAIFAVLQGDVGAFLDGMDRMGMIAPGAAEPVRRAVAGMFERLRGEGAAPLRLGADRILALKDEAKALLEETPGVQLPNDLLLYAKTLSYLFTLGRELAPGADLMGWTVPWLLRFLAARPPSAVSAPADAGPAGG